jgi:acetyltransferase-like isoleucine patch superfamily enzyme
MLHKIRNLTKSLLLGKSNPPKELPNFGVQTGAGTKISRTRRPIDGKQYISLGDNSYIGPEGWLCAYDSYPYSNQKFEPQILIGNDVFIGSYATITGINKIIIEDGVETGDFIFISDHTHSLTPEENISVRKRRLYSRGYVKIGAYTALGIHVTILPGVTLGKYCVVGANSVVTHSFPDYSIIMGNPGVLVKSYSMEDKKWVFPEKAVK